MPVAVNEQQGLVAEVRQAQQVFVKGERYHREAKVDGEVPPVRFFGKPDGGATETQLYCKAKREEG